MSPHAQILICPESRDGSDRGSTLSDEEWGSMMEDEEFVVKKREEISKAVFAMWFANVREINYSYTDQTHSNIDAERSDYYGSGILARDYLKDGEITYADRDEILPAEPSVTNLNPQRNRWGGTFTDTEILYEYVGDPGTTEITSREGSLDLPITLIVYKGKYYYFCEIDDEFNNGADVSVDLNTIKITGDNSNGEDYSGGPHSETYTVTSTYF